MKALSLQVANGFKNNKQSFSKLQTDIFDLGHRITTVEETVSTVTNRVDTLEFKVDELERNTPDDLPNSEFLLTE